MSPFAGLGLAVDKPGRCYLTHPVTMAPLRVRPVAPAVRAEGDDPLWTMPPEEAWPVAYVDVLSFDSAPAQEHRFAREEQERLFRRELNPAEAYDSVGVQLARMTTGWLLCDLTGRALDVPCTYDLARELYNGLETRWLRSQVFAFALTPGNFQPAT